MPLDHTTAYPVCRTNELMLTDHLQDLATMAGDSVDLRLTQTFHESLMPSEFGLRQCELVVAVHEVPDEGRGVESGGGGRSPEMLLGLIT